MTSRPCHLVEVVAVALAGVLAAERVELPLAIGDEQLQWFEDLVSSHPAEEGWKLFVFTHANELPGDGPLRKLREKFVDGIRIRPFHSHKDGLNRARV